MKSIFPLVIIFSVIVAGCAAAPSQNSATTSPPQKASPTTAQENSVLGPVGEDLRGLKISGWVSAGFGGDSTYKFVSFYKGTIGSDFYLKVEKENFGTVEMAVGNFSKRTLEELYENRETFSAGDGAIVGIRNNYLGITGRELFATSKKGNLLASATYLNTKSGDRRIYEDGGTIAQDKEFLEKIVKVVWGE